MAQVKVDIDSLRSNLACGHDTCHMCVEQSNHWLWAPGHIPIDHKQYWLFVWSEFQFRWRSPGIRCASAKGHETCVYGKRFVHWLGLSWRERGLEIFVQTRKIPEGTMVEIMIMIDRIILNLFFCWNTGTICDGEVHKSIFLCLQCWLAFHLHNSLEHRVDQ